MSLLDEQMMITLSDGWMQVVTAGDAGKTMSGDGDCFLVDGCKW